MYIKLDYFYFSAFDLELKLTDILNYILPFSEGNTDMSKGHITNYQVLGRYLSQKVVYGLWALSLRPLLKRNS